MSEPAPSSSASVPRRTDATSQTPAARGSVDDAPRLLAERVRAACVDAALDAYEEAGIRGLCLEGRWEAAVAAVRQLDLSEMLERYAGVPRT